MQQSKADIRSHIRQQRRSLPQHQRTVAAQQLAQHLLQAAPFRRARRVACFFSADGEVDTGPVIQATWQADKELYLPVLAASGPLRLWFRRYQPDTPLTPNRYDIPEPSSGPLLDGSTLDLVLTPLVAFDSRGNRLGMGGGYYDRSFAYLLQSQRQRPRLLGLAYALQQVPALLAEPWDVPLWGVITEQGLQRFVRNNDRNQE